MAEGTYIPEVRPDVHSCKVDAVGCMVLCEVLACQSAPPAKHTAASWQTAQAYGPFSASCPSEKLFWLLESTFFEKRPAVTPAALLVPANPYFFMTHHHTRCLALHYASHAD